MPPTTQPFEIELGSDTQIQVDVERVVMGDERARDGAAVERLHHRCFHFEESALIELAAE